MSVKSNAKITTTGKVRAVLADALDRISRGELPAQDGQVMVGLANQITKNMAAEIKYQTIQSSLGLQATVFGSVCIGDSES
jgi:hypothetical protein